MIIIVDINRIIIKRILVDSWSSCNALAWKATIRLLVNLAKLKKVAILLVGIRGKPIKVESSVELLISLGKKGRKRTVK